MESVSHEICNICSLRCTGATTRRCTEIFLEEARSGAAGDTCACILIIMVGRSISIRENPL